MRRRSLFSAALSVSPSAPGGELAELGAGVLVDPAGIDNVLTLAGLVSLAGALLALWLVREHKIERQPTLPAQTEEEDASRVHRRASRRARGALDLKLT